MTLVLLAVPLSAQASTAFTGVRHQVQAPVTTVYSEHEGRALRMSLYRPEAPGPHPVMLVVYGGGWRLGGRWSEFARILAREGIAGVSVEIRTAQQAPHPGQVQDVRRAIQALRFRAKEWNLNPQRLAVGGISSGGHLAALAAYWDDGADPWSSDPVSRESTRVRCLLAMSAPLAFEGYDAKAVTRTQWGLVRVYLGFPKGTRLEALTLAQQALVRAASPEAHVSMDDAPAFLLHELGDPLVPALQGVTFYQALVRAEIPNDYALLPGSGHGAYLASIPFRRSRTLQRPVPEFWSKLRQFLREHLVEGADSIDLLRASADMAIPELARILRRGDKGACAAVRARLAAISRSVASGSVTEDLTRGPLVLALIEVLLVLGEAADDLDLSALVRIEGLDLALLAFAARRPEAHWPLLRAMTLRSRWGQREAWLGAWDLAWAHHREACLRAMLSGEVSLELRVRERGEPRPIQEERSLRQQSEPKHPAFLLVPRFAWLRKGARLPEGSVRRMTLLDGGFVVQSAIAGPAVVSSTCAHVGRARVGPAQARGDPGLPGTDPCSRRVEWTS